MEKRKYIRDQYLNQLLKISEEDGELSAELLNDAGIDAKKTIARSLKNISNYEYVLSKQIASSKRARLLEVVLQKIEDLFQIAPERVNQTLANFTTGYVPVLRFKGRQEVEGILGQADLAGLSDKLDELENDLNRG